MPHKKRRGGTAYGASIPLPDIDIGSAGEGPNPVGVGQVLAGLQPGTTYHYRVLATNALGQTAGVDQTFTTLPPQPPAVSTGQAGSVAQNAATLTGTVDTEGLETTYEFDIGVDTSYGTRIFGDAGVEPGPHAFTAVLRGLMASAIYHYRILATNTFGTSYGADQTFTTSSYPSSALAEPETPPLLATPLLTTAGSTAAKAAAVRSTVHTARHPKARKSSRRPGRHKRKSGSDSRAGRPHNANRGGK